MNIKELIHETEAEELAALSQFFSGRADDKGIPGEMDVDQFSELASKLGFSVDPFTLQQLVQQNQVGGIDNVSDEKVQFNSEKSAQEVEASQKKKEMTMQQSAKRAMNKRK
jgi:hypothetical protein